MSYRSTEWQDRAACSGVIHFADWLPNEQRAVCRDCPVKAECIELGLATVATVKDALDGVVYGGLHPKQFAELVRARGQRHLGGKP
jgi:hypothetical protein